MTGMKHKQQTRQHDRLDHSTSSISVQPVEKITYDDNSSKRYRNILRHYLELKWITLLQTPHPLVLMIIFTVKVTFLDYLILMFVLTLSDLSFTLKHSGRHMALSRLFTLSISSLRNLDIEANKFYDRAHDL